MDYTNVTLVRSIVSNRESIVINRILHIAYTEGALFVILGHILLSGYLAG